MDDKEIIDAEEQAKIDRNTETLINLFEDYRVFNQGKERTQEQIDDLKFIADMIIKIAPQYALELGRAMINFKNIPGVHA